MLKDVTRPKDYRIYKKKNTQWRKVKQIRKNHNIKARRLEDDLTFMFQSKSWAQKGKFKLEE